MLKRPPQDLSAASTSKPLPGRCSKVGSAAAAAVASFLSSTCCSFSCESSCSSDLILSSTLWLPADRRDEIAMPAPKAFVHCCLLLPRLFLSTYFVVLRAPF